MQSPFTFINKLIQEDQPQSVFVPADKSLDIVVQAQDNLDNFQIYLNSNDIYESTGFPFVSESLTQALTLLAKNNSDTQIKVKETKQKLDDLNEKVAEKIALKEEALKKQEANEQTIKNIKIAIQDNQSQLQIAAKKIELIRKARLNYFRMQMQQDDLRIHSKQLHDRIQDTKTKLDSYNLYLSMRKGTISREELKLTDELAQTEEKIRTLLLQIKDLEAKQKLLPPKSPPPQPKTTTEKSMFVINDNVSVSREEIDDLQYMVTALNAKNEQLLAEKESLMMDMDCLLQENMGLKQIIRSVPS